MKNLLYIFFLSFTCLLHAQTITQKSFSASGITSVNIIGENVFKISVETKPIDVIQVQSRIEGEYNESVIVVTENKGEYFYIEAKIQPIFKDPNDKLSAHKVTSIEVVLVIPENLSLLVNLYQANIKVKGQYKKVLLNSNSGNCVFDDFKGNAKIVTRDGNIDLATNQARIIAKSINGLIKREEIDTGKNKIEIKTINGNITVIRSQ